MTKIEKKSLRKLNKQCNVLSAIVNMQVYCSAQEPATTSTTIAVLNQSMLLSYFY